MSKKLGIAALALTGTLLGGCGNINSPSARAYRQAYANHAASAMVDETAREIVRDSMRVEDNGVIYVPITQEKRLEIREWNDYNENGVVDDHNDELGKEVEGYADLTNADGLNVDITGYSGNANINLTYNDGHKISAFSNNSAFSIKKEILRDSENHNIEVTGGELNFSRDIEVEK